MAVHGRSQKTLRSPFKIMNIEWRHLVADDEENRLTTPWLWPTLVDNRLAHA